MFSKKNEPQPAAQQKPAKRAPSVLAEGLALTGDIESDGDIHIEGTVTGNIQAMEVVVGPKGKVIGQVKAKAVRIHGGIDGQIQGSSVTLAKSSKVNGDILHNQLTIEPGAFLEGHCRRMPTRVEEKILPNTHAGDATAKDKSEKHRKVARLMGTPSKVVPDDMVAKSS